MRNCEACMDSISWLVFLRLAPKSCKSSSFLSVDGLAAAPMQVRRSLSVVLIDEDGATRPVPRLSGNTKSLLMMFVLFTFDHSSTVGWRRHGTLARAAG